MAAFSSLAFSALAFDVNGSAPPVELSPIVLRSVADSTRLLDGSASSESLLTVRAK